jgi:hypothetical protein
VAGSIYNHQSRLKDAGNSKELTELILSNFVRKHLDEKTCPCCRRRDVKDNQTD